MCNYDTQSKLLMPPDSTTPVSLDVSLKKGDYASQCLICNMKIHLTCYEIK